MRVGGAVPAGGWPVPVADPAGGPRRTIELRAGAVATSTTAVRRWRRAGQDVHHLVEPSTGRPARTGVLGVIAAAEQAWWAEGIAKAALIAGAEAGATLMRRHGVAGWIVDDGGTWIAVGAP